MAYICEICGKGVVIGRSQRHGRGVAGKRWKKRATVTTKVFRPNLQTITLLIDSEKKTMKLCTKCIKRYKKDGGRVYTPAALI